MTMGFTSWMRASAIVVVATIAAPGLTFGAPGDSLVVTGDAVNVRTRPTTGARILLQVNRDEPLVELSRDGEWVQVELPDHGAEGWIHGSLVALAPGAAAARAPVPEAPPAVATPAPAPEAPAPAAAAAPAVDAPAPVPEAPAPVAEAPPAQPVPEALPAATPETPAATAAVGTGSDFALERFQTSVDYLNDRAVAAAGIDLFEGIESGGSGNVRVMVTNAWALMPPSGRQSYLNTLFDRWVAASSGAGGQSTLQIVGPDGAVVDQRTGP
jgi:hypothetical protein